ncbi:MAG TPA: zinc finger domain-containing protein, partial [Gemmatales bacterium]|nr:zinc finger domain-containing protein [Gemmatales bacterium]
VRWILQEDEHRFPQEKDLGPEPFELNGEYVYKAMISSKRCLKALLLDQSIVAGVRNLYADESLYRARLLPTRAGNTLTNEESNRLCRAIRTVIQRAIEKKGSTISNFYFGNGDTGSYQNEFDVYDRGQEPCKRCRTPLKNIRLAGRTTTYCALCQK